MRSLTALTLAIAMSFSTAWAWDETMPLPPDVSIVAPSPEVALDKAAFSGKWVGMWIGRDRILHTLVVESISNDRFSAVYSVSDSLTSGGSVKAVWQRIEGSVIGGKLQGKVGNAVVEYELQSDGSLNGVYTNSRGFSSTAMLKKAI